MFISDWFIGFYSPGIMLSVYLSFALIALIGIAIKKARPAMVIFSALGSSLLFFIVTNFSVWFFANWYVHSVTGLFNCYIAAIPFFRNTMLGDLFFSGLVFGAYETYCYYQHIFNKAHLTSPQPSPSRGEGAR
jgi:hypothetical protein